MSQKDRDILPPADDGRSGGSSAAHPGIRRYLVPQLILNDSNSVTTSAVVSSAASTTSLRDIDNVHPGSMHDLETEPDEQAGLLEADLDGKRAGGKRRRRPNAAAVGPYDEEAFYGAVEPIQKPSSSGPAYSTLVKRIKYYVPATAWIPNYSSSLLGGDILAGLTVASLLIPQSISYASALAKLSPVTGLIGSSIPGIVYALLGTSKQLNVAPEAALSLILGQTISSIRHDYPEPHDPNTDEVGPAVATVITLQAGLFSFLLGFFRLGFIDVVLSRALLSGFISSVAVIIMIEQLIPMLGLTKLMRAADPETTIEKLTFLIKTAPANFHPLTTTISLTAFFTLILIRVLKSKHQTKWYIYRIPEVLLVVVISTILSARLGWADKGIDTLGNVSITPHAHFFQFPLNPLTLPYLRRTTPTAALLAVVGFFDSIVAAKQNAARFGYSISPNRELVALGAANLVGATVPGTLPAFGSITRSRINGDVGGRTQMASLVCGVVVLAATFWLLPWLWALPKCVLAAVITLVVFSLLAEAPHDIMYYWKMKAWKDFTLMSLTFFLSIIYNIEVGVVVSLVISLLLVVHRSSKPRMTILGRIPGTDHWKPIKENPEAEESVDGALIVRIKESLYFANTAQLKERLRRLELYGVQKSHPSEEPRRANASALVFHLADVDSIDASAAQIFHNLLEEYQNRGVELYITHLRPRPYKTFAKAGIVELLGVDAFRETVADAMALVQGHR